MIPIYKPYIPNNSLKYAYDAIDSTWISSHGKYLDLVEKDLKKIIGCDYLCLTSNGTAATHLVAISLKLKYPNIDKLIVPSNVYIAAWNMFKTYPDYTLIPIDSDINTWNIDIEKLKHMHKLFPDAAFLCVHNIGNIINVPQLKRDIPNLVIVEDNCEGFLGSYENKMTGTASLSSSISFFGNKNITSGEGGAFCTNDENLYNEIFRIRGQGHTKEKFIFSGIGYNYRMTNVQAAILYGQLKLIPEILENKKRIFSKYKECLAFNTNIKFQEVPNNCDHSHWMFGIRIENLTKDIRLIELKLLENGIETRPMFPPINYHSHFKMFDAKNFKVSKQLYDSCLILPSYPTLKNEEIEFICITLNKIINE